MNKENSTLAAVRTCGTDKSEQYDTSIPVFELNFEIRTFSDPVPS